MTAPIRRYRPADADALARIFYRAVHEGAASAYDAAQRRAWAPGIPQPDRWRARLSAQTVFVAEHDGAPIGFMSIQPNGHLDLAYVLPDFMGKGIAAALLSELETEAGRAAIPCLTIDASHLARRFFQRHGWQDLGPQTIHRSSVELVNFKMKKHLSPET